MLKRLLPRSLFGRALLIVVTPMVVLQLVAAAVTYDRYLERMTRRMARSVTGDITFVSSALDQFPDQAAQFQILALATRNMNMSFNLQRGERLPGEHLPSARNPLETELFDTLEDEIQAPFEVRDRPEIKAFEIRVQHADGILQAVVPMNRFTTASTQIVVLWTVGTSMLLIAIAILFLRNQVSPIARLAHAAEQFGKGRDVPDFKPAGAAEVRKAATAFLQMRARIQRQIRQRTEMLAGVSHDLRTPLTRMKLSLAMLNDSPDVEEIRTDIDEMERMLEGYLAFARGANGEEAMEIDVAALLAEVVEHGRRQGASVELSTDGDLLVLARPQALKRCITNLVENARRYAQHIRVQAARQGAAIIITVDDDGPGIPPEQREAVFRPFYRLEESRNQETGGVGLGLAIARDTIRSHGGDIVLAGSPVGGLRATVRLPV